MSRMKKLAYLVIALTAATVVQNVLQKSTTDVDVYPTELVYTAGIIDDKTVHLPYEAIDQWTTKTTPLDSLFGTETLQVQISADQAPGTRTIEMRYITEQDLHDFHSALPWRIETPT